MGLINMSNIDTSYQKQDNAIIDFNNQIIEVVSYLSIRDKYDLIQSVLQKSYTNKIYDPFLIDVYFELGLVYMYSNIVFSIEDKTDEFELYDKLKSCGLLDLIIAKIPTNEICVLKEWIHTYVADQHDYNLSLSGLVNNFINSIPEQLSNVLEQMKEASPELFEGLMNNAALLNVPENA